MIGSKIKRHFINRRLNKLLAEHQLKSSESRNGKIQTIGILTTNKVYTEFNLRGIVSDMLDYDEVDICSFVNIGKDEEKSPECFTENDLNWRAEIKDASLGQFRDKPYDLLICLYSKSHSILDYIACTSKATFKVGLASKKAKFFDLDIHLESNEVNDFFNEMKKYLQILKKL